jgi:hypothetical protein
MENVVSLPLPFTDEFIQTQFFFPAGVPYVVCSGLVSSGLFLSRGKRWQPARTPGAQDC